MTVKELRKKLKNYPKDMVVSVNGYEGGVTDIFDLTITPVKLGDREKVPGYYGEHEDCIFQGDESDDERLVIG